MAVLSLLMGGCSYKIARAPAGRSIDPNQAAGYLEEYNSQPQAVRVQGRLKASGQGRADFGASVAQGSGLRLDAVGGPFSSPLLAVACKTGEGCQVLMPSSRKLYLDSEGSLDKWLGPLVRGRLPAAGTAATARTLFDGRTVLTLSGESSWIQEVEFPHGSKLPSRMLYLRANRPEMEILYLDYSALNDHPFPMRMVVNVREPRASYEIEIEKAVQWVEINEKIFSLAVPPGVTVERVRRDSTWENQQLPLWIQPPG